MMGFLITNLAVDCLHPRATLTELEIVMQLHAKLTTSSRRDISLFSKIHEWFSHFSMRLSDGAVDAGCGTITRDIAEYSNILKKITGNNLKESKILEIGYGARPLRMFYLLGMDYDVSGIDLDRPVLGGTYAEFIQIFKKNGAERLAKSLVRHFTFDVRERRRFADNLRQSGGNWRLYDSRFHCGDAASNVDDIFSPESFDVIYSEDVFEHIEESKLLTLCSNMRKWLRPGGIALIRLNPISSLNGGHYVEWYPHQIAKIQPRRTAPWEHLRLCRYEANTYLNKLRLCRYREIFNAQLECCHEYGDELPGAKSYLTPEIRKELADYSEEELLTGNVMFVLRRSK